MTTLERLLRRRMAVQRLWSPPLSSAADAVRLLTCVQAQDAPLAAWSLGLRSRRRTLDEVRAEQAGGAFVRTHILRSTWHFVAAEDLRWILHTTSSRVESTLAYRHRQLGLDDRRIGEGIEALEELLTGARLTRRELGALADPRLPDPGEALGHLLLVAELRGLVCSGPPRGGEHRYALVEETIVRTDRDEPDPEEGARRLALRFFTGHGPGTDRDLARWSSLTLTAVRAALAELETAGLLATDRYGEERLWSVPGPTPRTRRPVAQLLPGFDEAFLTFARLGFPRTSSRPWADRSRIFAQAGGGVVLLGYRDVGTFKRTLSTDRVTVRVRAEDDLTPTERDAIASAAGDYADFVERELRLTIS